MSNKKNNHIKDPIDIKYREVCDKGLISNSINHLIYEISSKLGEIRCILCIK